MHKTIRFLATIHVAVLSSGCTGMNNETSDLVKIISISSFFMALFGAVVAMFTAQTERRYVAALVAFVSVIIGVLFAIILIA